MLDGEIVLRIPSKALNPPAVPPDSQALLSPRSREGKAAQLQAEWDASSLGFYTAFNLVIPLCYKRDRRPSCYSRVFISLPVRSGQGRNLK